MTGTASTTECPRLLGLSSGSIQDWQIASSSHWTGVGELTEAGGNAAAAATNHTGSCQPKYARLYQSGSKAWCAKHRSVGEWILVDLGVLSEVSRKKTPPPPHHISLLYNTLNYTLVYSPTSHFTRSYGERQIRSHGGVVSFSFRRPRSFEKWQKASVFLVSLH